MTKKSLEQRIEQLEAEVARLRSLVEHANGAEDWLDKVYGTFANDPIHEEAMRLGREWRESFRPARPPRKKK